ncbi:MAG: hypothetical protein A2Y63_05365 [Candidatus Riflebacteria bacterium RBG_13_59_9]|nr:MAG: hypothetical protein A2Y63_05365 [Candidatus Riflebacteria bacterium RBG_13_59_9]
MGTKRNRRLSKPGHVVAVAVALFLLAALGVVLSSVATGAEGAAKSKKKTPVFKPGAEVTLKYFFVVPSGFHFNEEMPAAVTFDKKEVEKLPVTIKPLEYIWTCEDLSPETTEKGGEQTTVPAQVKVSLDADCPLGDLKIPVVVDVFFCNVDEGWCTSSHYDTTLKIGVSDSDKALKKGSLKVTVMAKLED